MNAREKMKSLKMTSEKLKKLKSTKMIIPNFLAEQHHSVLFGASGSMKSSIVASILLNLSNNYEIDYWGFDVNISFKIAFMRIVSERELDESVNLFADVTSNDFYKNYEDFISKKESLENVIIVIDTYKFITSDVNDKRANKKALHFIKQLQSLGATILSIAHTNKDGEHMSGTAEMEQDTDAVFRVDAIEENDIRIATISKDGRVRFTCNSDLTFEVSMDTNTNENEEERWYDLITTIKLKDEVINIKLIALKEQEDILNKPMVELIIKTLQEANGSMLQSKLLESILQSDECTIGNNKLRLLIPKYKNSHWLIEKVGNNNRTNNIVLIDTNHQKNKDVSLLSKLIEKS